MRWLPSGALTLPIPFFSASILIRRDLLKWSVDGGLAEALRWGTAAGAAACLTPGTQLCQKKDVRRFLDQVRVEKTKGRTTAPTK